MEETRLRKLNEGNKIKKTSRGNQMKDTRYRRQDGVN